MKFGKVSNIEEISFQLPPLPPGTRHFLQRLPQKEEKKVFIGCTGWSMKEWTGKLYPKGAKSNQFLHFYSRQFDTIELNTTHYRIPAPGTVRSWYEQTPDGFRFCPKIPQSISHSTDFASGTDRLPLFCEAIQGLGEKLGPSFFQLPPYFDAGRKELLFRLFDRLPRQFPFAFEFRHTSWFDDGRVFEEVCEEMQERGIGTVITDVAGRRDVLHQRLTAPFVLIRFVGNGLHPTDYSRIDEWVERLSSWLDSGLPEIYFFPHEPDNILAPELSLYLAGQLSKKQVNARFRTPRLLSPEDGEQMKLF
jgi:uncharacterized protein YecE (DUF72 family)